MCLKYKREFKYWTEKSKVRQYFSWKLFSLKNFLVWAIDTNLKLSFCLKWRKWLWELSWIIPNKMEMAVKYQLQFCYEKKIACGDFRKVQTLWVFSSDSELKKGWCPCVRFFVSSFVSSFGSSLSRSINLYHFRSTFQADFKGLCQVSLSSLLALS